MDILTGNPEIGQELLQLLYAKLKQKRQELEELRRECAESALVDSSAIQAENEELKDELSELRLRLTAAQDTSQDTKPPLQVSQRSEHIPQPPQQKKEFKDEGVQRLQQRLKTYEQKREAAKSTNQALSQDITLMEAGLHGIRDVVNDLKAQIAKLESKAARSALFDPQSFNSQQRDQSSFSRKAQMKSFWATSYPAPLPSPIREGLESYNVLIFERGSVAWGKCGLDIAVHFLPTFQYTVRGTQVGWSRTPLLPLVEKQPECSWEVIGPRGHDWFYYGTYQCAQYSVVRSDIINDNNYDSYIAHAIEATFPQKQEIAPVVVDFARDLYTAGVLTIDILGLERIGFRKDLDANLRRIATKLRNTKSGKTAKKREGEGDDGDDNARPTKKKKGATQKAKKK